VPRSPAANKYAENLLLGALLHDPQRVWPQVEGVVEGERDFTSREHGLVFAAIESRMCQGAPCDRALLASDLYRATGEDWNGFLERVQFIPGHNLY